MTKKDEKEKREGKTKENEEKYFQFTLVLRH